MREGKTNKGRKHLIKILKESFLRFSLEAVGKPQKDPGKKRKKEADPGDRNRNFLPRRANSKLGEGEEAEKDSHIGGGAGQGREKKGKNYETR